jgi:hypothetical protein
MDVLNIPRKEVAPSQLHLALARLERTVEQMTTRLDRLENSHRSLRRRVVVKREVAS